MDVDVLRNLVVLLSVAVAAPLLADRLRPVLLVPTVVLELVLGIVVGPDLLGWVQDSTAISGLSNLGLALLMFLAGYEIDFAKIRGLPVDLGLRSWAGLAGDRPGDRAGDRDGVRAPLGPGRRPRSGRDDHGGRHAAADPA